MKNKALIDALNQQKTLPLADLTQLIATADEQDRQYAADMAAEISRSRFGRDIYTRGIVEFSNYCKNDCYYCGIRRGNRQLERFRLTDQQIMDCCQVGYQLGFRTFVLQSGEDMYFTDERMTAIIRAIKGRFPDCAVTLSLGEKERSTYEKYFAAGADRYLLRHETANSQHYARLHPPALTLANRMRCLRDLRDIGFQTGCGCMVGSPYQTAENLAEDLLFMADFKPHMVGIGPYLPHRDTPFRDMPPGSVEQTLLMLSLTRILLPSVLLPATTALGTAQQDGRILGILAGANVIMPNLSPLDVRQQYELYDGKLGIHSDAREGAELLQKQVATIGYRLLIDRGDYRD
ncbi:MAG: [FeFe] hydrogenase H-cluster radical SAM maturase HydE [Firmicutes bacterium]|nr:[FeFe] hydrogenase H-cluster radical SAM maturase HydE [Bacillota bacterium]